MLLQAFFSLATLTVVLADCPDGWKTYKRSKCFFFSKDNATFAGALKMCETIGLEYGRVASLATIENNETNSALGKIMKDIGTYGAADIGYFIGANDIVTEGKFFWASTGQAVTYVNWGPAQPNNRFGSENCVALRYAPKDNFIYQWTDDPCDMENLFICEMASVTINVQALG